jgi:hypothetical protein
MNGGLALSKNILCIKMAAHWVGPKVANQESKVIIIAV